MNFLNMNLNKYIINCCPWRFLNISSVFTFMSVSRSAAPPLSVTFVADSLPPATVMLTASRGWSTMLPPPPPPLGFLAARSLPPPLCLCHLNVPWCCLPGCLPIGCGCCTRSNFWGNKFQITDVRQSAFETVKSSFWMETMKRLAALSSRKTRTILFY